MNAKTDLGVREMARRLKLSPAMVVKLRDAGMPMHCEVAAAQWRTEHVAPRPGAAKASGAAAGAPGSAKYAPWRARRERALALQAEQELAERAGDLISREQLRAMFLRRRPAVRDALLGMSDRIAPLVAAETDVGRCAALIDEEVGRALNALAELGQAIENYPKGNHEDDSQEPGRT